MMKIGLGPYMSGWKTTPVTSSLWPLKDLATEGSCDMEKFCMLGLIDKRSLNMKCCIEFVINGG